MQKGARGCKRVQEGAIGVMALETGKVELRSVELSAVEGDCGTDSSSEARLDEIG